MEGENRSEGREDPCLKRSLNRKPRQARTITFFEPLIADWGGERTRSKKRGQRLEKEGEGGSENLKNITFPKIGRERRRKALSQRKKEGQRGSSKGTRET